MVVCETQSVLGLAHTPMVAGIEEGGNILPPIKSSQISYILS